MKRGWFLESYRHGLSARGIKTSRRSHRQKKHQRVDPLKVMFSRREKYFALQDSDFVEIGGTTYIKLDDGRYMNVADPTDIKDEAGEADYQREVGFLGHAGVIFPEAAPTAVGSYYAEKPRIIGLREVGKGRYEVRLESGETIPLNSREELEALLKEGQMPVAIGSRRLEPFESQIKEQPGLRFEQIGDQTLVTYLPGVRRVRVELTDFSGEPLERVATGVRVEPEKIGAFPATVTIRDDQGGILRQERVKDADELKLVLAGGVPAVSLYGEGKRIGRGRAPPQPEKLDVYYGDEQEREPQTREEMKEDVLKRSLSSLQREKAALESKAAVKRIPDEPMELKKEDLLAVGGERGSRLELPRLVDTERVVRTVKGKGKKQKVTEKIVPTDIRGPFELTKQEEAKLPLDVAKKTRMVRMQALSAGNVPPTMLTKPKGEAELSAAVDIEFPTPREAVKRAVRQVRRV